MFLNRGWGGEDVTVKWRKLHEEELCYLYSSKYIIMVIKLMGLR
jgi:hypothetical protein